MNDPCQICGEFDFWQNTRCACCDACFCIKHYPEHWNGVIPLYVVIDQDGHRFSFREYRDAEREYESDVQSLKKHLRFARDGAKLRRETITITTEEWIEIFGPESIWFA
jgi:hypothetical protein